MAGAVLVVGGYGAFGARAVRHLARLGIAHVIIAGRDLGRAEAAARDLAHAHHIDVSALAIDAERPDLEALKNSRSRVVLNASGPFQAQSYALAQAAIAAGMHYVDLADSRPFVEGITTLDAAARAAGVLVASGASSVPALSCAAVDALADRFQRIEEIDIGISPANGFDPGIATTRAVLCGLGRPMPRLRDGAWGVAYGWQDAYRRPLGDLGPRWFANCDVPDLTLLPQRYPDARTVRFTAGVEVAAMFGGLWLMSWLARARIVPKPDAFARPLMWVKRRLSFLGSDAGGMYVRVSGIGRDGKPAAGEWTIIARQNHGPFIPPAPAAVLAARLANGDVSRTGATACLGLMKLSEIEAVFDGLDVVTRIDPSPGP
ncbi:MAG: saccharopine dehydrogenase NADP-binding domain-containing protein [Hyphomicrobiales bacterium]|nr:saccharopine dehydrogenase NADP-binding domain-containing protein [Hyphomicrobiales bacterium]